MREAGLEEVKEYVLRRHNMVAQYISTRTIMKLCEGAVHRPGTRVSKRWWKQEGLDLVGACVALDLEGGADMGSVVVGGG